MKVQIQRTSPKDFPITEKITREAFWNMYMPGCHEHLVLHQLRNSDCYVKELDLIAKYDGDITGHIIATNACVIDRESEEHEVLCVGPFSVLPAFQNSGIGKALLDHLISEAIGMGIPGMILFGDPVYYHRFGFVNAKVYGITTKDNLNFDPFMALELQEDGLAGVKGRFFEDDAFVVGEEDLFEFERKFPYKEKGKPKIDIPFES